MPDKKMDTYTVNDAISAHVRWKYRLYDFVRGSAVIPLNPDIIKRVDLCELSKWIEDASICQLINQDILNELVNIHYEFHSIASKIVSLKIKGKEEKAQDLLADEFKRKSEQIVYLLTEINQELREIVTE